MSGFDSRVTRLERAIPTPVFLSWCEESETEAQAIERYRASHPKHADAAVRVFRWRREGETERTKRVIPYTPRSLQRRLHDSVSRFAVVVAHRRFGKTIYCLNHLVKAAIECQHKDGRFGYLGPTLVQVKDIAWDTLKNLTAGIPGVQVNESELRVDLPNGARIRLYGADHADRMRGLFFDGIVIDEYAYMSPRVWTEVIRPALVDRKGWAIFIGTPMGRNNLADLYDGANDGFPDANGLRVRDPDWTAFKYKASETGIVPQDELDAARRLMTPEQYAQEFEVSFDAAVIGAYYASLLHEADTQGRIRLLQHEPSLPVHTGWDLGIGDPTAIWFAQVVNGEVRIIDYYESSGVGLDHYVAQLRAGHRASWVYGLHFFPHDVAVKELGSGMSRQSVLRNFGIMPTVIPASSVDDGISQVRFGLRRTWFNSERCGDGLKALRQYRSEWDEKRQVLKPTPCHDWTSHAADAARYLFIGLTKHLLGRGPLGDPSMSAVMRGMGNRQRFATGSPFNPGSGERPYGW